MGDHAGESTVELANVGVDPLGQLGERRSSLISRPASLTRRRRTVSRVARLGALDGDGEPPLEAVAEPRREGRELAGHAVGGEDDLAAGLVEGVEGVEELFLGVLLALEELDVVDQEDVEVAVAALEGLDAGSVQGGDELVGEATRRSCSGR